MAVRNANRNLRPVRESQDIAAEIQEVAVNDVIGTISLEERAKARSINPGPVRMGTAKDPCAEVFNLTIVGRRLIRVDQEIQL